MTPFEADLEAEKCRSDLQHKLCVELHRKLHYAPIKSPRRVVDVGTGNGSWAIEFAERNPNSDVLGIDLHCLSPSRVVPDNCSFDIASAQGYWDFLEGQKVDFIFQRFLGWIPDFEGIFTSMYDNLEPGGWVELHEWVLNFQSANGSMDGTALGRWNMLMQKGLAKMGKSIYHATEFKPMLRDLGFENIKQRKIDVPMNAWSSDRRLKRVGTMNKQNNIAAIGPLSYTVLCEGLGQSREEVDRLITAVKKDLENESLRGFMSIVVITAQKPLLDDTRRRSSILTVSSMDSFASTTESLESAATTLSLEESYEHITPPHSPPGFTWGVHNVKV